MENYKPKLEEQLHELEQMIVKSDKNLSRMKNVPDSHIHISVCNGCFQYYLATKGCNKAKYVKKKDRRLVERIAQRDYEQELNNQLKHLRNNLKKLIKCYDLEAIDDIYNKMPEGRKRIVIPYNEPIDDYIERWKRENPGGQNTFPISTEIYTANGIGVRSKSEEIIISLLEKHHVPYQYEPRLELKDGYCVYPDFVVLNVRKKKTIYWEHLGLISDSEYAKKNMQKLLLYEKSGYEVGDNLMITMESNEIRFDSRDIEKKIIRYCC